MQAANGFIDGFMLGLAVLVGAGATLGLIFFLLTQAPKLFKGRSGH